MRKEQRENEKIEMERERVLRIGFSSILGF